MKPILIMLVLLLSGCSTLDSSESLVIGIHKGSQVIDKEIETMLIRHEGYSRKAYYDNGDISVGHGRNLTSNGLTQEEALYLLKNDIKRIKAALTERFPVFDDLTNNRRKVLISMTMTLGLEGISKFDRMWAYINKGDYTRAGVEMYISEWCNQVGYRCRELAEMMQNG